MPSNISVRQHRASLCAQRCRDLTGWTLHTACAKCNRVADVLLDKLRPDRTLGNVLGSLRCTGCGGTPTVVVGGTDWGKMIKLVGPGAYG